LIFYERNNLSAFKKIFMDQYQFAVEHYFWFSDYFIFYWTTPCRTKR
jgi:hypothetical protein